MRSPHGRPVRVTTDRRGFAGGTVRGAPVRGGRREVVGGREAGGPQAGKPRPHPPAHPTQSWDRDEWDVSLSDGAVYRIFQDRASDGWFIDAIVD